MNPAPAEPHVLDMDGLIKTRIDAVAPTISNQVLGLVYHRPEPWADAERCFENAARKAAQDGGRMQFGWTFCHRYVEAIPGPGYLFMTHHAVWHSPSGHLIDVTPYPDPKHHPLAPGGNILFLVDDNARPVVNGDRIAPLPLKFFALVDDQRLTAYVAKLNEEEQAKCHALYTGTDVPG